MQAGRVFVRGRFALGSLRRDLKKTLHRYGMNLRTLFPGLDGIATHIRWARSGIY